MTHKTTLYVGLFDQHSHVQKFTTLEAFKIVDSLILARFGGATISESHGIYKHNDGSTVIEPSLRIELVHEDSEQPLLDSLVQDIKLILNQESILVTRQEMHVSFV
jgi:hypothetical protein